jgi:hypothetical protein
MSDNPLKSYFRQPKIYLSLPSPEKFYPSGCFEPTETGELPVYAMTAKDELNFKTPDALLNGQATVDVIQSCIPNIKNAWLLPSTDLDAILIAIRIATYGEMMDINTVVPVVNEERTYQLNLRGILDELKAEKFEEFVTVDDLVIWIRPLNYREFTQSALKTFEEQRVFNIVNSEDLTEEQKLNQFHKSFKKLTELTVGMVAASIVQIDAQDTSVTEPAHIQEFLQNADKKFYTTITDHIEAQKRKFSVKPLTVTTEQEDRDNGAPESYEAPIMFDQSNFFAQKY